MKLNLIELAKGFGLLIWGPSKPTHGWIRYSAKKCDPMSKMSNTLKLIYLIYPRNHENSQTWWFGDLKEPCQKESQTPPFWRVQ